MTTDRYLSRTWSPEYDCRAFAREVWRDLTKRDVVIAPAARRELVELETPEDPCLVLFRGREPHIGVFVGGRVLHLNETGARYEPLHLVAIGFDSVGFFR